MSEIVYLIHFDEKYKHARHYLGSTKDLAKRMRQHGTSKGARLLEVLAKHGIGFRVVRTWEGGFPLEIELKKKKKSSLLCPICRGEESENV